MATNELAISNGMMVREAKDVMLSPLMDLALAKSKLKEFQQFVFEYLLEGEDYGKIPGTDKPTLLKPGADKLCDLYGFADSYKILNQVEDFERNLFHYNFECSLISKRTGMLVATGVGSCNSYESKYRYRQAKRKCPACGKEAIIKAREEYGGGWLCHKKQDGCGKKFDDSDERITSQEVGKVINDDIPTTINTVLKMAKKRAKVDAVISATRSSGIFTQDMEDLRSEAQEHFAEGEREDYIKRKTESLKADDSPYVPYEESPDGTEARFTIQKVEKKKGQTDYYKISWKEGFQNTFDSQIGDFLMSLPRGTVVTVELKVSGKYKNIISVLDPLPMNKAKVSGPRLVQEDLEITDSDVPPIDAYEGAF